MEDSITCNSQAPLGLHASRQPRQPLRESSTLFIDSQLTTAPLSLHASRQPRQPRRESPTLLIDSQLTRKRRRLSTVCQLASPVCCSVLQRVAACCGSVLQCVAVCSSRFRWSPARHVAGCCNVSQCVAGKTGVTADRDKIEFRLFNSSSIFNITLR